VSSDSKIEHCILSGPKIEEFVAGKKPKSIINSPEKPQYLLRD
jgi:hypothetical protein